MQSMKTEDINALADENCFDPAALAAFIAYHDIEDPEEAAERFQDEYAGTHGNFENWAEDYAENTGMLESIPKNLRRYFAFKAFAHDAQANSDIYGIHLANGQLAVFYDGHN